MNDKGLQPGRDSCCPQTSWSNAGRACSPSLGCPPAPSGRSPTCCPSRTACSSAQNFHQELSPWASCTAVLCVLGKPCLVAVLSCTSNPSGPAEIEACLATNQEVMKVSNYLKVGCQGRYIRYLCLIPACLNEKNFPVRVLSQPGDFSALSYTLITCLNQPISDHGACTAASYNYEVVASQQLIRLRKIQHAVRFH